MPRYIDVDAFRMEYGMSERCEDCRSNNRKECEYSEFTRRDICGWLDDAPTVDAVPIDKLCKWLSDYSTAPGIDIYEVPKNHRVNRAMWKAWIEEHMKKED